MLIKNLLSNESKKTSFYIKWHELIVTETDRLLLLKRLVLRVVNQGMLLDSIDHADVVSAVESV